MLPQAFKGARPFVKRPDRFRVGPIEHPAAVATHIDETHIFEYTQMLRDRRLLQSQAQDDVAYGPLLQREIVQYLPPPRFSHRVKSIRCCRCAWHERIIHSYMGICQAVFLRVVIALTRRSFLRSWG